MVADVRFPSLLSLLCGLMVMVWSTSAAATDLDDCDQMTRIVDVGDAAQPELVEVVVPCAMLESGALGPDCHDAAFYVVNTQGTLLCRADVAMFAVSRCTDVLQDAPPASPWSGSAHVLFPAAVGDVTVPHVPPRAVVDIAAAVGPRGLGRGRDVVGFSQRPS